MSQAGSSWETQAGELETAAARNLCPPRGAPRWGFPRGQDLMGRAQESGGGGRPQAKGVQQGLPGWVWGAPGRGRCGAVPAALRVGSAPLAVDKGFSEGGPTQTPTPPSSKTQLSHLPQVRRHRGPDLRIQCGPPKSSKHVPWVEKTKIIRAHAKRRAAALRPGPPRHTHTRPHAHLRPPRSPNPRVHIHPNSDHSRVAWAGAAPSGMSLLDGLMGRRAELVTPAGLPGQPGFCSAQPAPASRPTDTRRWGAQKSRSFVPKAGFFLLARSA